MNDRGHLFWKKRWNSICSAHQTHDENCPMCQAGYWENVWLGAFMGTIYDSHPVLWMWLVNGKKFKKGRWKEHVETRKSIFDDIYLK